MNRFPRWCQLSLLITMLFVSSGQAQIRLVGELDPSVTTSYGDVWGFDDYAVLGTRLGEGVFIVDISDPTSPSIASQYFPSRGAAPQDVKVHDGIGYFAMNSQGGVDIVDLSDPTQPAYLANVPAGGVHNVFVSESFLFTTSGGSLRINVYDVSDPAAPEYVYFLPTTGRTHDMTVVGDRLYASNIGNGTTDIFDLSQMTTAHEPDLLGSFVSGPSTHSNWVTDDGNILVNAEERRRGKVSIFDVSDPENATLLASFRSVDFIDAQIGNHIPHNPVIVGDVLYVSWYTIGVQMFDISDPSNPVHIGRFDTQNNWGVYPFLGPDRILLSDIANGLKIVDVSSVLDGTVGDFNGDAHWDCQDIDLLVANIASGSTNRDLDMDGDGFLAANDISHWLSVASAKNLEPGEFYLLGDADLDGLVNGSDFLIWNGNKFTEQAAFCAGDFNGDGSIDGDDFLIWNDNRVDLTAAGSRLAVPEPSLAWWTALLLCVAIRRTIR